MISQANISPKTPMGANLTGGGATFRAWAPRAKAVYLNGTFSGLAKTGQTDDLLMARDDKGYWTGFVAGAQDGDLYHFLVVGLGSTGLKRDPYAREMAADLPFPKCACLIRSTDYPWHDAAFVTPDFSNMIVYQLHLGTYFPAKKCAPSKFLDVVERIEYLAALGVNVIQPLPVDEMETDPSLGYNGADLFSPDTPFVVRDSAALADYLKTVNRLLAQKGFAPIGTADISSGPQQLKAMVDLLHVYGMAVVFDVVYNHAGGFDGDDQSLYYWDRPVTGNNNDSLYFTDQDRGTGGLSFALWNNDVRQFLINNAVSDVEEFHIDGFRYDEISGLLSMNKASGWSFCRDLTDTLRSVKPRLIQNAEYWPFEFSDFPQPWPLIATSTGAGGAGFDVVQHDGLRHAVRNAVQQASTGAGAAVDMASIGNNLYPIGFPHGWQAVTCVENHDIVKVGQEQRVPPLADGSNPKSWYARSRSRFATGLLLTAPGIPQIFMGQEFLQDTQWNWDPKALANLINWAGIGSGGNPVMTDFLRFTTDLIRLRWNHPALRGNNIRVFHVNGQDRVIAFHRWLEGSGQDVVVAATLAEKNWFGYGIGFPFGGRWTEAFNSDVYDGFVNPTVAGNGGSVTAGGGPLDGFGASAEIVIPANGFVVFTRD